MAQPLLFRIVNVGAPKTCVDSDGGKPGEGVPVIGWEFPPGDNTNQQWSFEWEPFREAYKIRNRRTGKLADLSGGNSSNNTPVINWDDDKGANQLWTHIVNKDGKHLFLNVQSGTYLYLQGGKGQNGTPIVGYAADQNDAFAQWTLTLIP